MARSRKAVCLGMLLVVVAAGALGGVNIWTPLGPEGGTLWTVGIDPVTPSTVWAGGIGGAYKSTDGGAHWAQFFVDGNGAWGLAHQPTNPGVVLVADRQQRIWVTMNGGVSWTLSSGGLVPRVINRAPVRIAFRPGDPSVVYFARSDGLFRSTDGGANWSAVASSTLGGRSVFEVVLDPGHPATVWARVATLGIMKSTDGGDTFAPANTGLPTGGGGAVPLWSFAADPLAPATMYVGSARDSNVYRSADGGATWTPVNPTLPPIFANVVNTGSALLVVPGQGNVLYARGADPVDHSFHLYKSADSGATWSNVTGSVWTSSAAAPLAIPAGTPGTVYAALAEGLYVTTDGGGVWRPINTGLRAFDASGPTFDPATPSTWYVNASTEGIFKTTDGGATFSCLNANLIDAFNGAIGVDPNDRSVLYTTGATRDGDGFSDDFYWYFVKSTDGGASWQQVANPARDGSGFQTWGFAMVPTTPTTVFVAAPAEGVLKSADGGATFQAVNNGLPLGVLWYQDIVVTDGVGANALVGVTAQGGPEGDNPYRTTDGAASWLPTSGMLPGSRTRSMAVDPTNHQIVYAGTTTGIYKSTDGAATAWQPMNTGLPVGTIVLGLALDPNAPTTVYATGRPGPGGLPTVYRSTDGAATWSALTRSGFDIVAPFKIAVDPANPQHVVVAGRLGLSEITLDPTDTLNKGVPPSVESQVPNLNGPGTGDGNGDGIPDTSQANVASLPTATGAGYVTIAAPDASGVALSGVAAVPPPPAAAAPPGALFPYGMVQFTANNVGAGGCVAMTLYLPVNRDVNAYFKYGPTPDNTAPHWYTFTYDGTTGAEVFQDPTRTRIVLHLCDGVRGDGDVMANGTISDPGGPAVQGRVGQAVPDLLWPANHKMVPVTITGVTGPNGYPARITIVGITQDEPVNGTGDGDTCPDGLGVGTNQAQVRAERSGSGNGRVYAISFRADDGHGWTYLGAVQVGVPHDKKATPIDDGQTYDSTKCPGGGS